MKEQVASKKELPAGFNAEIYVPAIIQRELEPR